MVPTTITSRVGADGVLSVVVPLGPAEANREFRVTLEPLGEPAPMTEEQWAEWRAWVRRTAGSVSDPGFRRHDQGDYEVRESL